MSRGTLRRFPDGFTEIDAAFASLASKRADALVVGTDSFFFNRRLQLATLATRHAIPAIFNAREYAEAGGLMSYGTSLREALRHVGIYWPSPAWCQARRSSGRSVQQIRVRDQSCDRESARARSATHAARAGRRGDRMTRALNIKLLLLVAPTAHACFLPEPEPAASA
jgi:hypothetical protein